MQHPGKIGGGAKKPFLADPRQIDAARKIIRLKKGQSRGQIGAFRQALGHFLFAQGFGRGEDQRLAQAHAFALRLVGFCAGDMIEGVLRRQIEQGFLFIRHDYSAASAGGVPALRRTHKGAKARSCRRSISPSLTISSEAEKVEARTVRACAGVASHSIR